MWRERKRKRKREREGERERVGKRRVVEYERET